MTDPMIPSPSLETDMAAFGTQRPMAPSTTYFSPKALSPTGASTWACAGGAARKQTASATAAYMTRATPMLINEVVLLRNSGGPAGRRLPQDSTATFDHPIRCGDITQLRFASDRRRFHDGDLAAEDEEPSCNGGGG